LGAIIYTGLIKPRKGLQMIQLHEHLQKFTGYAQYADSAENPHENSVNKVAFTAIDQAIKTFMSYKVNNSIVRNQDVHYYNTEAGAINDNHHVIEDQLNTLYQKSTKLSHEFILNYYLSQDDGMYGIDVKIEFFTLPPDTVKQGPSRGYGYYFFSKMAVLHIDELHCLEYILG
tara:strand:- start:2674 stop:3192 length:519 start_codon:yes stop_codon:yes gene_type:complete